MAQTSDGLSMVDCQLEYSTNGADYTDISGFAASVEAGGGTRKTGEVYTMDGDTAIVKAGKREPLELTMSIVYTEGTADPYYILRPYYEAGSAVYFRWSPKGGNSGDLQCTSDAGYITDFPPPGGSTDSGDPIMLEWKYKTPKVTEAAVA